MHLHRVPRHSRCSRTTHPDEHSIFVFSLPLPQGREVRRAICMLLQGSCFPDAGTPKAPEIWLLHMPFPSTFVLCSLNVPSSHSQTGARSAIGPWLPDSPPILPSVEVHTSPMHHCNPKAWGCMYKSRVKSPGTIFSARFRHTSHPTLRISTKSSYSPFYLQICLPNQCFTSRDY